MNSPANAGDEISLTFIESHREPENPTFPSQSAWHIAVSVLKPLRIKTGMFPIDQPNARVIVNDNIARREVKVVKNKG
jgi:hypothetical protein